MRLVRVQYDNGKHPFELPPGQISCLEQMAASDAIARGRQTTVTT